MTIQVSITIWTVICFIALLLILKNLLFKPILKCMDSRNEHINSILSEKEEKLKAAEEAREKELLEIQLKKQQAEETANNMIAEARSSAKITLKALQDSEDEFAKEYELALEKEAADLSYHIPDEAERLSELFVSGLIA